MVLKLLCRAPGPTEVSWMGVGGGEPVFLLQAEHPSCVCSVFGGFHNREDPLMAVGEMLHEMEKRFICDFKIRAFYLQIPEFIYSHTAMSKCEIPGPASLTPSHPTNDHVSSVNSTKRTLPVDMTCGLRMCEPLAPHVATDGPIKHGASLLASPLPTGSVRRAWKQGSGYLASVPSSITLSVSDSVSFFVKE